jgi:putrescine importer
MDDNTTMESTPGLRRTLRLRDLLFMGLIIIQPTAPMPLFGVASNKANGHVVSLVLLAMVGMMFTAMSYGRMARVYPNAGSAYTYVGQEGVAARLRHQSADLRDLVFEGGR